MSAEKVLVYSTGALYLAEMLRQVMADNDIQAFIVNKQDSFYKIGDVELYVHPDNVIRAKMLIKEFETL